MDKKKIAKYAAVVIAALLLGLSQLGVIPDLAPAAKYLLDSVGFEASK